MKKKCDFNICSSLKNFSKRITHTSKRQAWKWWFLFWLYPLIGFLALVWFLLRVIPKPTRARYPCQQIAAPLASSFIVWLTGLFVSATVFRKARNYWGRSRYILAGLCLTAGVLAVYIPMTITARSAKADDPNLYIPFDPPNDPIGIAVGYYPGRVVWAYEPNVTSWTAQGETNYWWLDQNTDQALAEQMISDALGNLVNADNGSQTWQRIFEYFNQSHGNGPVGYQNGEKIAIKLNLNMGYSHQLLTNGNFPAPQVVLALLRQLVYNAGVTAGDITFYDATFYVPDIIYDRCVAEFPDVNFVDWSGGDGRLQVIRDNNCPVLWSDDLQDPTETYGGEPSGFLTFLPTCLSDANYIINLANLKGHRTAGITVCAKNNFGSICSGPLPAPNVDKCVPKYAGLHPYIAAHDTYYASSAWQFDRRDMGTYNPLVDLMCHENLGGKTLLYMIDALYAAKVMHEELSAECRWLSLPFDNDWTSSIFLSLDPVAIDSVALDFLRSEPIIQSEPHIMGPNDTVDNYLHEAALADNPPSTTVYDPEADGFGPESLGVHEHWNNASEKLYTRNLRSGEGIELISSDRLKGDINGGGINMQDFAIFAEYWKFQDCESDNGWCYGTDINNDGNIDLYDLAIMTMNWQM